MPALFGHQIDFWRAVGLLIPSPASRRANMYVAPISAQVGHAPPPYSPAQGYGLSGVRSCCLSGARLGTGPSSNRVRAANAITLGEGNTTRLEALKRFGRLDKFRDDSDAEQFS